MGYWEEAMKYRMDERCEVTRLTTVLKGFLYRHNEWAKETDQPYELMTPEEFWDSKRPYGNKDIPASIAFNLGWDYKRKLTTERMPEWVENVAWDLHEKVLKEIKEEK